MPDAERVLQVSGDSARNSGGCGTTRPMNPDFLDLLRAFVAADVRFLIVGASRRRGPAR